MLTPTSMDESLNKHVNNEQSKFILFCSAVQKNVKNVTL